jgi:hypothetical protein
LERELGTIAAYDAAYPSAHGKYPADLSGYQWSNQRLARNIEYSNVQDHGMIYYRAAGRGTAQWYSSTSGHGFDDD